MNADTAVPHRRVAVVRGTNGVAKNEFHLCQVLAKHFLTIFEYGEVFAL